MSRQAAMRVMLVMSSVQHALGSCSWRALAMLCVLATQPSWAAEPEASDKILTFLKQNVLDRKMVTTQSEPRKQDPATGKPFQRTFTRTSWYTNARKTDFGVSVQYNVDIRWKTFYLDEQGKPTGEPFDPMSYSTTFEISLAQYPRHEALHGIWRAVERTKDGKPDAVGPGDYSRVAAYVETDEKNRNVLRLDVEYLFPRVVKAGVGEKTRLGTGHFYETLWLEGGKLHRSQLWHDYHVDPQTLQKTRPVTEEKELYLESE